MCMTGLAYQKDRHFSGKEIVQFNLSYTVIQCFLPHFQVLCPQQITTKLNLCRPSGKETFQCYLSYSFLIVPFGNTCQGCVSSPANRKLICRSYRSNEVWHYHQWFITMILQKYLFQIQVISNGKFWYLLTLRWEKRRSFWTFETLFRIKSCCMCLFICMYFEH